MDTTSTSTSSDSSSRRLVRPRKGRVLAGVCAALARALGLDVAVIRVLWVLATVWVAVGRGSLLTGVVVYLVVWFVLPEDDGPSAAVRLGTRLRAARDAARSA